jgi:hypothetical protein
MSYSLSDYQITSKSLLLYCGGPALKIDTFMFKEYDRISDYRDLFNSESFRQEDFDKYATTFNAIRKIPDDLLSLYSCDKIGINATKATSHNEILLGAPRSNCFLGKFFKSDFSILVIPASLFYDRPFPASQSQSSFYLKHKDPTILDPLPCESIEPEYVEIHKRFIEASNSGNIGLCNAIVKELEGMTVE